MSNERLLDTLRSPYVSEKATRLVAYNQYVFLVAPGATRTDVRRAVEQMFDVKVEQVNVVNIRGKSTSFRSRSGRRQACNKAYVRLADGQSIDVLTKA